MAYLEPIKGYNAIFHAPEGEEDRVASAYVFKGRGTIVTAWRLSEEELENVKRNGMVYVATWGDGMAPLLVADEDTIRDATAEGGVLPRQS